MEKVGSADLAMGDATRPLCSIAAEFALLFLRELEPKVAADPELLVSTEAVLSFAALRRADPVQWQYWRTILERHEKLQLMEHLLREPARLDDPDWESKAARLIRLALATGLELFHDRDQQGWAAVRIGGHWENHALRSRDFRLFLLRTYYRDTNESPGTQAIRAVTELCEARAVRRRGVSRPPARGRVPGPALPRPLRPRLAGGRDRR
jgi:hypothetical protein